MNYEDKAKKYERRAEISAILAIVFGVAALLCNYTAIVRSCTIEEMQKQQKECTEYCSDTTAATCNCKIYKK